MYIFITHFFTEYVIFKYLLVMLPTY
ncbi:MULTISPECIES: stress response small protein YobI [Enterobacteriaceae]|nr:MULTISPECIES: stress response small protein YobI [Enterobacteriaceae]MBB2645786.1 hypothetical protein [Escherichia coli]QGU57588.1 hypothetical protein CUC39_08815 [Shigella boydii]QIV72657.1 hypothetical protein HFC67_07940 [Escherichia coli]QIV77346.1 hypothetical protein HFC66_23760 [Escherichia coli]QPR26296.1 stress response small protein YobI [Escherichia coli]